MNSGASRISRSSRSVAVLLLLFLPLLSQGFSGPADTLIVDGEVIYIEPQEKWVDADSMEQSAREDRRKAARRHSFSVGLVATAQYQHQRWDGSADFQPTDVFLDDAGSWSVMPAADIEVVWSVIPRLSVVSGVALRTMRFNWQKPDPADIAPDENRYRFENREGELWQLALLEVGPGFETDTMQIGLVSQRMSARFIQFPAMLRYSFDVRDEWQVHVDAGAHLRVPVGSSDSGGDLSLAMLRTDGSIRFMPVRDQYLSPPRLALALQAGVFRKLDRHWSVSARLGTLPVPVAQWRGPDWRLSTRDFFIGIGIHYTREG